MNPNNVDFNNDVMLDMDVLAIRRLSDVFSDLFVGISVDKK